MTSKSHYLAHTGDGLQHEQNSSEHTGPRYEEGQQNSHRADDSKDQRSLANRLAAETSSKDEDDEPQLRPTEVAKQHGNEPSRGAKIDEQIENEEYEELKRKGKID